MTGNGKLGRVRAAAFASTLVVFCSSVSFAQDAPQDAPWHVAKTSGEVWLATSGAQSVSLTSDAELKAGDAIRTGRNGRVLLTRGEETILLAPNSAIAVPAAAKDGMTTTIEQRAGSIILEVERKNVQHFEVVTPYLAAVVKGTQFQVSVDGRGAHVGVSRGQVEVSDFKTGQHALVLPDQAADVHAHGAGGLALSGKGTLGTVAPGAPRNPDVKLLHVPRGGLGAPQGMPAGQRIQTLTTASGQAHGHGLHLVNDAGAIRTHGAGGTLRIVAPLGDVKLNFQQVTHGLAHDGTAGVAAKNEALKDTIWGGASGQGGNASGTAGNGSPTGSGSAAVGSQIGASNASASHGNGSNGNGSNGNAGNGNGNANAGNGNGNGNANGNGNGNGNGNANSGVGNGNGNGNANGGVGNGNGNGNGNHG